MRPGLEALVLLEALAPVPALGGPFADLDIVLAALADRDIVVWWERDREQDLVELGLELGDLRVQRGDLLLHLRRGGFDGINLALDRGFLIVVGALELAHELPDLGARLLGELVLGRLERLLLAHQRAPLLVELEEGVDIGRVVFLGRAVDESLWVFTQCLEIDHGRGV